MTRLKRAVAPWQVRVEHLDDLPARSCVVVGCSGGPDSLALLALARARDLDVHAVYVDHGLRPDVGCDVDTVCRAAHAAGASVRVITVGVDGSANLEARARDARYDALERAAADVGAIAILVGHTRDDQAETVLLALLRGSATTGLAGMPAVRGRVRRPLLGLSRADTLEICARVGWIPVSDPMNGELRHRRVWVRRELVPMLARGANRDVADVLARQAALLRDDDELLESLASQHEPDDARALAALPRPIAARVVRRWLGTPPPSAATVDAVLAVARGEQRAVEVGGGRRVERVGARLHLVETSVARPDDAPLALPGRACFGALAVEAWIESAPPVAWPDGRRCAVADADRAGEIAMVRAPRDGERFRPLGRGGSKLVRDALVAAGVPAGRRAASPVVCAGPEAALPADSPLWVVGYRIDDRVRVTARTRRYLWLSVDPS